MRMSRAEIGVIGGSGLYQIDMLENVEEHDIDTPYGKPSDSIVSGKITDIPVVFLARHGRSHHLIPSQVPYRANIHALKQLGVRYLLSFSAVGSLDESIRPLDMVLPDQFIDLTKHRVGTFFDDGAVAHVSMAHPVCPSLSRILAQAVADVGTVDPIRLHATGTYLCIEGPQFSSKAESHWFRSMGANIIGMTNMPEAKLAREAQIAYATLAMVTDYDCWHPGEAHVTADMAIANLKRNAERAQQIAISAIQRLAGSRPESDAHSALTSALITPRESMNDAVRKLVDVLTGNTPDRA
jgi:5'-methylthioadenosine phosphorylase